MDWQAKFSVAHAYGDFLTKYGLPAHREHWQRVLEKVQLTPAPCDLLRSFTREMNVLCLAGTWCGDCAGQCPIFEHFARANPRIRLRFLDRDAHSDVQQELAINGGHRVPVIVFLSEDFLEVARYGERTLAQYRQLARHSLGPSCPTGVVAPPDELLAAVTQDWLDEFERVHLLLRLSPRLRQKHGD